MEKLPQGFSKDPNGSHLARLFKQDQGPMSLWAAMLAMHGTLGGGCATWLNPAADASWRRGRRRSQAAFSVRHLLVPCLLALGEAVAGARWQTRGSHDRKPPTAEAAHSITDAHFRGSGDGISGRAPETEETAPTLGWEVGNSHTGRHICWTCTQSAQSPSPHDLFAHLRKAWSATCRIPEAARACVQRV
eukprot:jgi/Mesen1/188/ME1136627C07680